MINAEVLSFDIVEDDQVADVFEMLFPASCFQKRQRHFLELSFVVLDNKGLVEGLGRSAIQGKPFLFAD